MYSSTVSGVSVGYGIMCHVRALRTHGNCLQVLSLFISRITEVCIIPFYSRITNWNFSKAINIFLMLVESGAIVSCLMADDSGSSGVFCMVVVSLMKTGPSKSSLEAQLFG